ncbi:hypothetical protein FRC07_000624 [Ceratobasidium sp. 392]|nr:hypothetical protein FRC07_000624 [Ceratobasidium sp. 392]
MSYQQQPYQENRFQQGHQPTGSVSYDYPHPTAQPEYNPYSDYNTVNAGYGQGGPGYGQGPAQDYRDDYDDARPGMSTMPSQATAVGGDYAENEKSRRAQQPGASHGGPARFSQASFIPPKSTGDLRLWRHDEHGNVWTKWVRPPDISFNGIKMPTNGSTVVAQTTGITINLNLAIGVVNPNFFAADFSAIQAKAFYPGVSQQIGGGTLNDINFPSHSDTNFLFPFSINYTEAIDPNKTIIKDIAVKCGFIGNSKSDIPVKYQLTLKLKVLGLTISPSFSGSASFSCPLQASDISGLGIDPNALLNG